MFPLLAFDQIQRTSPEFRAELVRMAGRLLMDPNGLAGVMSLESGFNPAAVNLHCVNVMKRPASECATGLIQFMPATARGLGTSVSELGGMSAEDQLVYVERFFRPHAGRLKMPGDYYLATFMPAAVGKPADFILGKKDSAEPSLDPRVSLGAVYAQNAGLDKGSDGVISVSDVTRSIDAAFARARTRPPVLVDETLPLGEGEVGPSSSSSQPSVVTPFTAHAASLPTLRPGCRGQAVALWRALLKIDVTLDFDDLCVSSTKSFQRSAGLAVDSIVGPKTWGAVIGTL